MRNEVLLQLASPQGGGGALHRASTLVAVWRPGTHLRICASVTLHKPLLFFVITLQPRVE